MLDNPNLPTRDEVKNAWGPFAQKYPAYLESKNRAEWFMQDKIVHDYMVGVLMTREEWEAEQSLGMRTSRRRDR